MRNIKLIISYDGTGYCGWQLQKNGKTVQEAIEKSIQKTFSEKRRVHGASRTDAGVHAKGQVAHFKIKADVPVKNISPALNQNLPNDIVVLKAEEVSENFHSQYDAESKTYVYYLHNSKIRDLFKDKYCWKVPYKLNVSNMRKEAKVLLGKHDFKAFQAAIKIEKNSVRTIKSITIRKSKETIVFEILGTGFLYNMARNIVGTLVEFGRGYFAEGKMKKILSGKDRTKAGPTAPAKGLFLEKIYY